MDKKVSVVIPTYNCSKYITNAVESVLDQSYSNLEILIVDDGSTDETAQELKRYSGHPSIKYLYQSNQGPGAARNNGMKSSTGDYICFLDSDDALEPGSLKCRADVLSANDDLMMVFSDYTIQHSEESCVRNYLRHNRFLEFFAGAITSNAGDVISFNDDFIDFFFQFSPYPIWTGTVMLKKQLVESIGVFRTDVQICEDVDYWVRIAGSCKIAYVQKTTAIYNHHRSELTTNNSERYHKGTIKTLLSIPVSSSVKKATIHRRISESFFCLGYLYSKNNLKIARSHYINGLRYNCANISCWGGLFKSVLPIAFKDKVKLLIK